MQRMLMALMAVVVAVAFSAPAFAEGGETKKKDKGDKPPKFVQMLNADEGKKKDEKGKPEKPK